MNDFYGKTAFVTGAARGIGLAIAKSLGARGAKVMISDVDEVKLASSRDALVSLGIDADFVVCNVSDPDSVDLAAQKTLERFGKIHYLVNNAGVSCGGPTGSIPIA
ncbi:MAG: SDR family NAD(P)-dependent oxidoreductase, partial [Paracoccaceae bacterium]|nr:SDR family NAD(P)-dependent oxidoreductase [Paracoccaceae bacterium]